MNIKLNFLENNIEIENDYVRCLEVENKGYFYRIVDCLNSASSGILNDDIPDRENNDLRNMQIIIDYFNFNQTSKNYLTSLNKLVKEKIDDSEYDEILKKYRKVLDVFRKIVNDIDIPLEVSEELKVDSLIKLLDLKILFTKDILSNLLLLIDINRELKSNCILVFINLKQYLKKEELTELYKYAIYNSIKIVLIDSQGYGVTLKYEKKLIIDSELEEFVL